LLLITDIELNDRDGRPVVEITCSSFHPHKMPPETQHELKKKLLELLASVLARVFHLGHFEQTLTTLLRDELALERAINFTSSFVTVGNVLGHSPKVTIADWVDGNLRDYPLKRSEAWDAPERLRERRNQWAEPQVFTPGQGEPPEELGAELIKHTDIEVVSLIREPLWDKASWCATAFLTSEASSVDPILALVFRQPDAGEQIFAHWRHELGAEDADERLRISIIRGITKSAPHAYRVIIGPNPQYAFSSSKVAVMVSRLHTMEPSSDANLKRFLKSYQTVGTYRFGHMVLKDGTTSTVPVRDSCILKRDLTVRCAWQVGRHDPDAVGIDEDEEPIIPVEHETDAPVLDLLRLKRERSASKTRR